MRPYVERGPLAAFALGVSSGFPFAMIAATLTTRLAQDGIDKKTVTAFSLAFLVYNLKFLWAWLVDGVRLPVLGRLGQRVSWVLLAGVLSWQAIMALALLPAVGVVVLGTMTELPAPPAAAARGGIATTSVTRWPASAATCRASCATR
ncbi:hypothetical protein [uncultured Bradyrhizobium sp.]|uniref:hypothetical protein n=1 Tax=uncultured Bradyrhizobium sp. TaxID=199684 RepID=UPI002621FD81|nr:hypothetical protein [uncultured Bradyrhizobium sp.]